MIIYFTGTGNSKHLAEIMAEKLQDQMVNAVEFIKRGEKAEFDSEKPFVFVCPVYGWQIPHVFRKFIMESSFSGNRDAYFVVNCGTDIGCADEKVQQLCSEKDFNCKGTAEVQMPENYIALFSAPDEPEAEKIIASAEVAVGNLADDILSGRDFAVRKTGLMDKCKSGFVNAFFYKFIIKDKAFYAADKCVSCGICADLCMLNNITMVVKNPGSEQSVVGNTCANCADTGAHNGKPQWGGNCTHCMACICGCPAEAIEYGRSTKHKRRYFLK